MLKEKIKDLEIEKLLYTLAERVTELIKQGKTEEKVTELVEAAKKELYTLIK